MNINVDALKCTLCVRYTLFSVFFVDVQEDYCRLYTILHMVCMLLKFHEHVNV